MKRTLIGLLLLIPAVSLAQGLRLRTAHSLYIANDSKDVTIENMAYTELQKWGRFKIVNSSGKADVVLRIDAKLTEATKSRCVVIMIVDEYDPAHELGDDDVLWFDRECSEVPVSWYSLEHRIFARLRKSLKDGGNA